MARGQSTAPAWLMGAISPEAKSTNPFIRTLPSQQAPEGFLFSGESLLVIRPAQAGPGDPDPGGRGGTRAPEARGLPEGTRRRPDTDGRANQRFAKAARHRERRNRIRFRFAAGRGASRMLVVKISDTSLPKR